MRIAVAVALVAVGAPALADTTPSTKIAQVMVLEPADPSYKLFHGAVWLDVDKAQVNYRWGGLHCKGRDLSDTSLQLLFAAYRAGDVVRLEWAASDYKDKPYRCITGFTIAHS